MKKNPVFIDYFLLDLNIYKACPPTYLNNCPFALDFAGFLGIVLK